MFRIQFLICACALVGLPLIVDAQAGDKKSESKVKATAEAGKIGNDGMQTVTITLEILKGWHIYANPVDAEEFADNKTTVTITAKGKVAANVKYPVGKVRIEKLDKEVKMRVYDGKVTLQANVTRAMGDTSPLQINIDVNACDDNNCLAKGVLKLTVPSTK